ncbi:MAG: hypothetical protein D8M58_18380 [Calditrichaeota bacterium]|nr:MAG: hypothetical protein DWQ03_11610 [Calditrichota bacterium]MBL1207378.1 hypothetical protein [Calditrichota bacterium]NOG47210.1 hypothetical protein [Calditrichota bacterium]
MKSLNRAWLEKNKKWFIPTIITSGVLLIITFVSLFVFTIIGHIKESEAYQETMGVVRTNEVCLKYLGNPIETGFLISASFSISGSSGSASLSIPISGPKGEGYIFSEAIKKLGKWKVIDIVFEINENRFVLLESSR